MRVNAASLDIRDATTSTPGTLNDLTTDLIMANNNNRVGEVGYLDLRSSRALILSNISAGTDCINTCVFLYYSAGIFVCCDSGSGAPDLQHYRLGLVPSGH